MAAAKKPKVLLVDDQAEQLPEFAAALQARGYEVVQKHFADWGDLHDTIREAMKPANRIDVVLTDLMWRGDAYGSQIALNLKEMGFNGAIAVHTSEMDQETDAYLKEEGLLGLFKKRDWDAIDQAIKGALQGRGEGVV
jgi:DNA-binding NtrC family response regulator